MSFISVKEISKEYLQGKEKNRVLDHVSLEVEQGEFLAITGESGAGKSTLLNVISTIDQVSEGCIEYNGTRIDHLSQKDAAKLRLEQFGFVFQKYYLMPNLNVYDNIVLPMIMAKRNIEEAYLKEIAILLEIENQIYKMPDELSGGQQQRVAIARALLHHPKVIFADEPTGNLDSRNGQIVFELLKQCAHKYKQTVFFVTHNKELAESTDRKIVLRDGAIVEK